MQVGVGRESWGHPGRERTWVFLVVGYPDHAGKWPLHPPAAGRGRPRTWRWLGVRAHPSGDPAPRRKKSLVHSHQHLDCLLAFCHTLRQFSYYAPQFCFSYFFVRSLCVAALPHVSPSSHVLAAQINLHSVTLDSTSPQVAPGRGRRVLTVLFLTHCPVVPLASLRPSSRRHRRRHSLSAAVSHHTLDPSILSFLYHIPTVMALGRRRRSGQRTTVAVVVLIAEASPPPRL